MDPTILSLCSGGGGLDLGIRLALPTTRTICYVEIEAYACAILVARMETGDLDAAPLWTDLRTFPSEKFRGRVDGIIGGYPCQPFSVAGKRRGANDPRHLWPAIREHVEVIQPRWCFFENVANHLRLGFREVAGDLHSLGYHVAATLVTAAEVGAPHKRERLFILAMANTDRDRREGSSLYVLAGAERQAIPDVVGTGAEVANANTTRLEAREPMSERPRERLAGTRRVEGRWATEPHVGRVAHGTPNRVDRLRLLGNGVVPQQAAYAFRLLSHELSISSGVA